ncbi:glycosyltransferase family 4 protein [Flavobacterium sp.]|uniref:glycosyltransferase family 4 protein n=1 Tax=Flavobacterium sp. TaxID=239 RepID=UPI00286C88E3|nr:glycosyltransferase family 4 protein [Flavobacterium sp.]
MKTSKIIITEQPIPFAKNGSWTQRIEYFLKSDFNNIDHFICGKTNESLVSKTHFFKVSQFKNRIINKFFPDFRFKNYIDVLNDLFKENDHLIICVIDNIKLKNTISDWIEIKKLKNHVTLIFYNCGYSYFLEDLENKKFLKNIDEMIFLTKSAYQFNKNKYSELTPEISVLNNPIDKNKFHPISKSDKEIILKKYNFENKIVYLWLSHDREKKGLDIVLNAWKDWANKPKNVELLIVGANRNLKIENVHFLGQISTDLVNEYYKLTHVYLFPTLWKEGFGLSLSQAICSGCFCIAADNGGVSDFFLPENGILIKNPNQVENWKDSYQKSYLEIENNWQNNNSGNQILDYEEWSKKFAAIFNKWHKRLNL